MGKHENDTRKAVTDLEAYIANKDRPPVSVFVRMLYLRYGFSKRKLNTILNDAYPDYEVNEETDRLQKVQ